MGGRVPGPTCTTRVGKEWIDDSTLCRTRSGPSGPLGMVLSLVMGGGLGPEANPVAGAEADVDPELAKWRREKQKEDAEQLAKDEQLIGANVELIAQTPFGRTQAGKKIVEALRTYCKGKNIVYGGTLETSRADWDGEKIYLSDSYRAQAVQTIVELVHEGSHVTWRMAHPRPKSKAEAEKDDVADETLARSNQLAVYKYLLTSMRLPPDEELEKRLRRTGGHSGG